MFIKWHTMARLCNRSFRSAHTKYNMCMYVSVCIQKCIEHSVNPSAKYNSLSYLSLYCRIAEGAHDGIGSCKHWPSNTLKKRRNYFKGVRSDGRVCELCITFNFTVWQASTAAPSRLYVNFNPCMGG